MTIRGPGKTANRTPTFRFYVSEDVEGVRCSFHAVHFQPCTSPYTTPRRSLGPHTLYVRAIDEAGNRTDPPAQKTFKVVR